MYFAHVLINLLLRSKVMSLHHGSSIDEGCSALSDLSLTFHVSEVKKVTFAALDGMITRS